MSDWTDRLAEALEVTPLDDEHEAHLLEAARAVAHEVERKDTPVASYLMGAAAGARIAAGATPGDAFAETIAVLRTLLGDQRP